MKGKGSFPSRGTSTGLTEQGAVSQRGAGAFLTLHRAAEPNLWLSSPQPHLSIPLGTEALLPGRTLAVPTRLSLTCGPSRECLGKDKASKAAVPPLQAARAGVI